MKDLGSSNDKCERARILDLPKTFHDLPLNIINIENIPHNTHAYCSPFIDLNALIFTVSVAVLSDKYLAISDVDCWGGGGIICNLLGIFVVDFGFLFSKIYQQI